MQISFTKSFHKKTKHYAALVRVINNLCAKKQYWKKKFFLAKVKNYKFFLAKVKNYIDIELNPSKNYFYDNWRYDHKELKTVNEILEASKISKSDYEHSLWIFDDDDDFQIY